MNPQQQPILFMLRYLNRFQLNQLETGLAQHPQQSPNQNPGNISPSDGSKSIISMGLEKILDK